MKKINLKFLVVFSVASIFLTQPSFAHSKKVNKPTLQKEQNGSPVMLSILGRKGFCKRMNSALTTFGHDQGLEYDESMVLASEVTDKIIGTFRAGGASEFIDLRSTPYVKGEEPSYLHFGELLSRAMKVDERLFIGFDFAELRHLPRTQKNSHIVLIVRDTKGVSKVKTRAVIKKARELKIKISIVWVGSHPGFGQIKTKLSNYAHMAALTHGKFVDMGGDSRVCPEIL